MMKHLFQQYSFLFEELVKRDFKKKYKRTTLGMLWSILSPLCMLLIMRIVFTQFFGRDMPYFTTYLFAGNIVYSYIRESTMGGMVSLMGNSSIISKVAIPKYIFVFSSNVSTLINFLITVIIFFIFAALDGITFSLRFFMLMYPLVCLIIFNIGVGLILSAAYVFFRDMQYLYNVFMQMLMYCSAIFYSVDSYPVELQRIFLVNPIYVYIKYFRQIVIDGVIPSPQYHLLMLGYALLAFGLGFLIYRKNNQNFLYYM